MSWLNVNTLGMTRLMLFQHANIFLIIIIGRLFPFYIFFCKYLWRLSDISNTWTAHYTLLNYFKGFPGTHWKSTSSGWLSITVNLDQVVFRCQSIWEYLIGQYLWKSDSTLIVSDIFLGQLFKKAPNNCVETTKLVLCSLNLHCSDRSALYHIQFGIL